MADQRFTVVFSGRLVDGADGAQVRENLAKVFKADAARIDGMFSGKRVVIKSNLPEAKARNYQAVLAKAGAVVELVASGAQAAEPAPAATTPSSATPTAAPKQSSATTARSPQPPPQAPDLTIAEPGVILVEYQPPPPAEFDTTQFDLAEVGVTLIEPAPVVPADFDTSTLALAPPGAQLSEPEPVPPADFDTSGLSLADDR